MVQSTAMCIQQPACGIVNNNNSPPVEAHATIVAAGGGDDPLDRLKPYCCELPRVPSSSGGAGGRIGKSRSRSRLVLLRRAPTSSATNLFEADLSQRLTRVGSSGVGLAAAAAVAPTAAAAATKAAVDQEHLGVDWRPRAGASAAAASDEDDDDAGLAFRIDRAHSWGGQERRVQQQQQQKEQRKLSEIIFATWFFHRPTATTNSSAQMEDEEAATAAAAEQLTTRRRSSRLTDLLLKQFSARSDFRDLNLGVPQSM